MEEVIYDRTNTDVQLVKQYREKIRKNGFDSLTQAEQALWIAGMKGAYNYTDYNRVGRCMNYLSNMLAGMGYSISITAKTDWSIADEPTTAQLAKIITDLNTLRNTIALFADTPDTPSDFEAPTYVDANAIEKILYDLNRMALAIEEEARRCGTFNCGEGDVLD